MFSKCTLELIADNEISYQMASLFQGVLMELIPAELAEQFHISELHLYSQHLERKEGKWYWTISVLNDQLDQVIIKEILLNLEQIKIKKKDMIIRIGKKTYESLTEKQLMNDFYEKEAERYQDIQFLTPTSFKQRGEYLNYPDLRCIFQSLMNKYDQMSDEESMVDEDTLEQLCDNSKITNYELRTIPFHLEGTKIVGFTGNVRIRITGSTTMMNFAELLFRFGEYSGVGIKTSIGMGAIARKRRKRGELA